MILSILSIFLESFNFLLILPLEFCESLALVFTASCFDLSSFFLQLELDVIQGCIIDRHDGISVKKDTELSGRIANRLQFDLELLNKFHFARDSSLFLFPEACVARQSS